MLYITTRLSITYNRSMICIFTCTGCRWYRILTTQRNAISRRCSPCEISQPPQTISHLYWTGFSCGIRSIISRNGCCNFWRAMSSTVRSLGKCFCNQWSTYSDSSSSYFCSPFEENILNLCCCTLGRSISACQCLILSNNHCISWKRSTNIRTQIIPDNTVAHPFSGNFTHLNSHSAPTSALV